MANISRRDFIASAGLLLAGTLVGCGSNGSSAGSAASGTTYTIGVIQLTEHSALDAANKGFVEALKKSGLNVKFDQQNAQNDQSACQTISSKFVSDGVDLIYAIATPAAQAAAAATTDIPIVGCAITDYAASGLVQDNDKPGTNVTGASDLTPVAEQLEMMQKVLPDVKKVGLLYCTAESNSDVQIKAAKAELDKLGIEYDDFTVSSSNEIQSVVESAVGKVDALYSPHRQHHRRGRRAGRPDLQGEQASVHRWRGRHVQRRWPVHPLHQLQGPGQRCRQDGHQDLERRGKARGYAHRAPFHQEPRRRKER